MAKEMGRSRYFVTSPIVTPVSIRSRFSNITTPSPVRAKDFEDQLSNHQVKKSRFFVNSTCESETEDAACCAICLESLTISSRGKLDSCSHVFCVACILQWSTVSNACPLCKQRFSNIRDAATNKDHAVFSPQRKNEDDTDDDEYDEDERPYLSDGTDLSGFIVSDNEEDSGEEQSDYASLTPIRRPRGRIIVPDSV